MHPSSAVALPPKPLLRGVSHQFACFAALIAGVFLVGAAPAGRATIATSVYVGAMVLLFGVSATYHRRTWRPNAQAWMKRLDHASIFILIAGTYTPVCMLAMHRTTGNTLLLWVWAAATLGIGQAVFWSAAPRYVAVALYLALGWTVTPYLGDLAEGLGTTGLTWVMIGGVSYSVGALIYAFRRPDPIPRVFGYHEVFHVFVIIASICHFVAIYSLVSSHAAMGGS